jgi:serine phosphatase RsbU (regulator of sigma subunit)
VAARFRPARDVSGDFYDAFPLTNNQRLGFVIADVCDKGLGAALFMVLFRTLIRAYAQQHYSMSWTELLEGPTEGAVPQPTPSSRQPGARSEPPVPRRPTLPSTGTSALKNAVSLTNRYILSNHGQTGMFATLFFGVLDPATGALAYVNCGHDPPILLGPSGPRSSLPATGPALGIMLDADFAIRQTSLEPGDVLLSYTDGVTEARNARGEFYTKARLLSLVETGAPSAAALLDRIEANVRAYMDGAEPADDITMLALRRAPGAGGQPRSAP